MTCGYSRYTVAVMIPSRKAGDILAGMWALISQWRRSPRVLVRLKPCDPEPKGVIERRNGYYETSFMPGRPSIPPADCDATVYRLAGHREQSRRADHPGASSRLDRRRSGSDAPVGARPAHGRVGQPGPAGA